MNNNAANPQQGQPPPASQQPPQQQQQQQPMMMAPPPSSSSSIQTPQQQQQQGYPPQSNMPPPPPPHLMGGGMPPPPPNMIQGGFVPPPPPPGMMPPQQQQQQPQQQQPPRPQFPPGQSMPMAPPQHQQQQQGSQGHYGPQPPPMQYHMHGGGGGGGPPQQQYYQQFPQQQQQQQPYHQFAYHSTQAANGNSTQAMESTESYRAWVGKFPADTAEELIRALLESCGYLNSWKRGKDPESGETKSFGFAQFLSADSICRALRVLTGFPLEDKMISVVVQSQTKERLKEQRQKHVEAIESHGTQLFDVKDESSGVSSSLFHRYTDSRATSSSTDWDELWKLTQEEIDKDAKALENMEKILSDWADGTLASQKRHEEAGNKPWWEDQLREGPAVRFHDEEREESSHRIPLMNDKLRNQIDAFRSAGEHQDEEIRRRQELKKKREVEMMRRRARIEAERKQKEDERKQKEEEAAANSEGAASTSDSVTVTSGADSSGVVASTSPATAAASIVGTAETNTESANSDSAATCTTHSTTVVTENDGSHNVSKKSESRDKKSKSRRSRSSSRDSREKRSKSRRKHRRSRSRSRDRSRSHRKRKERRSRSRSRSRSKDRKHRRRDRHSTKHEEKHETEVKQQTQGSEAKTASGDGVSIGTTSATVENTSISTNGSDFSGSTNLAATQVPTTVEAATTTASSYEGSKTIESAASAEVSSVSTSDTTTASTGKTSDADRNLRRSNESQTVKIAFGGKKQKQKKGVNTSSKPVFEEDDESYQFRPSMLSSHGHDATGAEVFIPKDMNTLFAKDMKPTWLELEKHDAVDKYIKPWVISKVIEFLGEDEPAMRDLILNQLSSNATAGPHDLLEELQLVLEDDAKDFMIQLWQNLLYLAGTIAQGKPALLHQSKEEQ